MTLSPDGEWVATLSGEKPKKLVLLPTGAGEAKTVPLGDIEAIDATFVPGSRRLAVFGTKAGAGNRIFLMDWEGRDVRVLGPEDPASSAEVFAGRQESRHPELEVRCADLERWTAVRPRTCPASVPPRG